MNESYGRDLDLNLLRVFVVVASARSVTRAAAQLYLTQPAISAALRRLTRAVGAPLFARSGRGLALTPRGQRLFASARPLLESLIEAALSPPAFDPKTSDRTLRLGLSDGMEGWLLPRLMRALRTVAPRMRLICVPVQFRSVGDALEARSVDLAISVADELPASVRRQPLLRGGFVCLFDPRRVRIKARISERDYFAREHVIVSYNADLRGIVEDMLQKQRRVRCSVASFSHIGALVEDSPLLATLPAAVAEHVCQLHPPLATASLPFDLSGAATELLWPAASEEDEANRFARELLIETTRTLQTPRAKRHARPDRRTARRGVPPDAHAKIPARVEE
jgi:LysR family transcriptional activator of mexEF-oprN operon